MSETSFSYISHLRSYHALPEGYKERRQDILGDSDSRILDLKHENDAGLSLLLLPNTQGDGSCEEVELVQWTHQKSNPI